MSLLNESIIYSDCLRANARLVDYKAKEHYIVKHLKSEFVNGKFYINAIENFFYFALLVTLQKWAMQSIEKTSL